MSEGTPSGIIEFFHEFTTRKLTNSLILTAIILLLQLPVYASSPDEDVVLSFSHPAIGQYFINTVYSNNTVYLPATELFNLLYVHYEKGKSGNSLTGTWLNNDNQWQIDVNTHQATIGKEHYTLTTDDYRLGDLDLFLSPAMFERMFGLRFTINMETLSVSLEFDKTLPVEEKYQHEQLRKQLEQQRSSDIDYPLLYPRSRKVAAAGVADYNVTLNANKDGFSGSYTLTGGMELLGGDLQGSLYGNLGNEDYRLKSSNVNWRYALNPNAYLTSVWAGQIITTGLQGQRIIGAAISNDPIEPRKVYNTYSMDGNTIPDSEVELYINSQLTSFTRADALGYYRFNFSLTYGTIRINLRIYTPSGEILTEERQLQIPFTFLPQGVVSYNAQAGIVDDGLSEINMNRYAFHGNVAWGLTNTLTAKAGIDYFNSVLRPIYYGSLSARLFDQYLLNIDAAPGAYYRATASVTYASSRSYNLNFTRFESDSLYNARRAKQEIDASVYLPFRFSGFSSGFRFSGENYLFNNSNLTDINLDLNTNIKSYNIRANYQNSLTYNAGKVYFVNGTTTGSVTYTFSRTPGLPVFVRGMFVRAQAQYDVVYKQLGIVGAQFSRAVMGKGRINVNLDHDFRTNATQIQAGFIFDLDKIRATSHFIAIGDSYNFQQSLNGSIGLDAQSAYFAASNREQVSRAAVSVLMFVDNNDNGKYDAGEEKIPSRALRLDQSAQFELGKDSILRITQLQSYWRYNAEIVQSALPNATLAPLTTEFSFVTDPNRYKRMEIPLYRTGVIEGTVTLRKEGEDTGLGGVRLLLKSKTRTYEETIRTFNDGGFYASNLLPGKYTLEVDPTQLTFLNATCKPERIEFEVKALAGGDYLENLKLNLIAKEEKEDVPGVVPKTVLP